MNKKQKIEENRNQDGTFAEGNAFGRMPKKGLTILDLTKLTREYEKTQDKTILKHYFERLFENDRLLGDFIDRYVPKKQLSELTGPGGIPLEPTTITLKKTVYITCPLKSQCPIKEKVEQAGDDYIKTRRIKREGVNVQ
ncbi:hypothetical protein ES708_33356 [subsurface metagenome]